MDNKHLKLNANLIVSALQKPASEFTKADIIDYIVNNDIRMVNFMYPGGDGKLKTLNFVINDLDYLETILTCGERVDGSSLFSFIQAGSSDLYVLPRFRTAFVDPFAEILPNKPKGIHFSSWLVDACSTAFSWLESLIVSWPISLSNL